MMTATTLAPRPAVDPIGALGKALRLIVSIAIAAMVTLGLFMLMRSLISFDTVPPAPVAERVPIDIGVIPDDRPTWEEPTLDTTEVEVPPLVRPAPVPSQERPVEPLTTGIGPVEPDPDTSEIGAVTRLPPPVTLKIPPVYPARELQRGIEGSCVIQYDVLGDGSTTNARVLRCDSRGFERASLDAVAGWTHSVVMGDDPNAIVNRGLQTQLDFRLDG